MNKQIEKGASLFFEGRAWYDKSGGNVYHSVRVWVNGEIVAAIPMRYGYENAYHMTALEKLVELGYLPERLCLTVGTVRPTREYPAWQVAKMLDIIIYSSLTFGKKSELFKAAE